jgi:manganese-dependent inorganic pyrophosphatase
MLTDILLESSKVIYTGDGAGRLLATAFRKTEDEEGILLDGIISRKKQFIPALMAALAAQQ